MGWKHVPNTDETYFFTLDSLPIYLAFVTYADLFMPWSFLRVEAAAPKGVELADKASTGQAHTGGLGPHGMEEVAL